MDTATARMAARLDVARTPSSALRNQRASPAWTWCTKNAVARTSAWLWRGWSRPSGLHTASLLRIVIPSEARPAANGASWKGSAKSRDLGFT